MILSWLKRGNLFSRSHKTEILRFKGVTMHDVNLVCDYIISRCKESNTYLDLLKLQKLLYYCQAWNLAHGRGLLFEEEFQAWIHGPVCRPIYDRFIKKGMYSAITTQDIMNCPNTLTPEDESLICAVLSTYAIYTGDQLEYLTHTEQPWIEARNGAAPYERSQNVILEDAMQKFYGQRITGREHQ